MAFVQNFNSGFDPALFIYLNPELNIDTVEEAQSYIGMGRWSNFDKIPSGLDPITFLSENKDSINISQLNSIIKNTNVNIYTNDNTGSYYPTIYKTIKYIGSNTFTFLNSGDFKINNSNLQINDEIKITNDRLAQYHVKIANIIDDKTFSISFHNSNYTLPSDPSTIYNLYGIKIYDVLRLAKINFLDVFTINNYSNPSTYVDIDCNFNYNLYKVLYPDSRNLSKDVAYVEYINSKGLKIGNVEDFIMNPYTLNSNAIINNLKINQTLNLDFGQETGKVIWNDVELYYVTNDVNRHVSTISPYFPGLITEYAIKNYIYNMFYPTATFCNIVATGNTYLTNLYVSNDTDFNNIYTSNLYVSKQTNLSKLKVSDVAVFNSNVYMPDLYASNARIPYLQGYSIGIGMDMNMNCSNSCRKGHDIQGVFDELYCKGHAEFGTSNTINTNIMNVNGIVTATNINNVSDIRLKRNISRIKNTNFQFPEVVSYNLYNTPGKKKYGFIAQELEEYIPEAVYDVNNYILHINKIIESSFDEFQLCDDDYIIFKDSTVKIKYLEFKEQYSLPLFINSISYNTIKMIDYQQILMALILNYQLSLSDFNTL